MQQEMNKYSFFRHAAPREHTEASFEKISREIFFWEAFP
jgi:hypothetical protein